MNERILVVEDDASIRNLLEITLTHHDYEVILAKSLKEAFLMFTSHRPDLTLLDLGLPDGDGIEFVEKIRTFDKSPIIVISARDKEKSKIKALDLGADDYLTKPFSTGELLARIRVSLRHANRSIETNSKSTLEIRDLVIDIEKHTVTMKGNLIKVTPIEFKLLTYLARHAGKVLVHRDIIKEVWGEYYQDNQSLRVFMANLRRKIEEDPTNPQYILTEVGIGYKMVDE